MTMWMKQFYGSDLMPRRAQKWVLHENKDGSWDLSKGGRYYYNDLSSKGEAVARLRNHFKGGETVVLEAPDGYRTNITNQLKRGRIL